MSSKRLSAVETQLLRDAIRAGEQTQAELAEAFGINKSAVQYHATRMGLTSTDLRQRRLEESQARVDELLREGKDVAFIATETGVAERTVRRRKEALGLLDRDVAYLDPPYPPTDGTQPCAAEPELFFVTIAGSRQSVQLRERIESLCGSCPFARPCLAYALAHNVDGWWAGTSKPQRAALRRKHGIAARPLSLWYAPRDVPTERTLS
jgi:hypothetical protein